MSTIARALAALLLLAVTASPQVITGTVLGALSDGSGSYVPNAEITLRNGETNVVVKTLSIQDGSYVLPLLPPGVYELTIELAGFKSIKRTGILVDIDSQVRVDVQLTVGGAKEVINVQGGLVAMQTETSGLNTNVSRRQVSELPNFGRNGMRTVILSPGVVTRGSFSNPAATINTGDDSRQNASSFTVNGGRPGANEILLDGAPNTCCAFNEVAIEPNLDAIGEVRLETNNYSAEFGRSSGAIINIATRSGADLFHGTAYDFVRNPAFNANSFYNNMFGRDSRGEPIRPKGSFNLNQFGGNLGGPLKPLDRNGRMKVFFFGSYEGLQFSRPTASGNSFTVPSVLERTGDFSQTKVVVGNTAQPVQIFQPYAGTSVVANGVIMRQPFSDGGVANKIPPSKLDANALKIVSLWPLPNVASPNLDGSLNFYDPGTDHTGTNQMIVKMDQYFGESHRGFFRTTHDWTVNTPFNHWRSTDHTLSGDQPMTQDNPSATIAHTWIQSPTSIFEFRASIIRVNLWDQPEGGANTDLVGLGFAPGMVTQNVRNVFPYLTVNVPQQAFLHPGISAYTLRDNHSTNWAFMGNWTKVHGSITHRAGADYRVYQNNFNQPNLPGFSFNAGGLISFTKPCDALSSTCDARLNLPNYGNGLADLLIGAAMGDASPYGVPGVYTTGDPTHALTYKYLGLFSQNDWRATRALTINLGVRWEAQMPVTDRYNRLAQWDANALNATGTPGKYIYSGVNGVGRGRTDSDWNDFGPRVGFAWRATQKMVIRAGYGISYDPISGTGSGGPMGIGADGFNAPAYMDVRPTSGPQAGYDILTRSFFNSFTGGGEAYAPNANDPRLLGRTVVAVRRNQRTPYTQQWNFAIQRELPGKIEITVAYVGSKTTHAFVQQTQLSGVVNVDPAVLQAANGAFAETGVNPLNALVPNPFYGISASGNPNTTGPTIQAIRLLEPYPAYDGVVQWHDRYASAYYDALQINARHSFRNGIEIGGHYTFSKSIDYGESNTGNKYSENGGTGEESFGAHNMRLEKSVAPGDLPHRAVLYFLAKLPLGKNGKYLANVPVLEQALGGWQLSGILTMQDGFPLGIAGGAFGRPDIIGNPILPSKYQCIGDGHTSCPLPDGTSVVVPFGRKLYFNPHAFVQRTVTIQSGPNAGSIQAVPYYWGTAPRLNSYLRGYGVNNLDLALSREFNFREGIRLQFRIDAYNACNRFEPNDANTSKNLGGAFNTNPALGPIGSSTSASFGTTSLDPGGSPTAALPRNLQLSLRLSF